VIKKIDPNSEEFIYQLEKTVEFTKKVNERFGFVFNPENEITESVQQGLTRNKLIYGTYYCPCFMVQGETKEERKKANNRICPCKPAIEEEIPSDGRCHCGIFCTPDYAQKHAKELEIEKIAHTHSRGLTKEECEFLLQKEQLDHDEIEMLLEAREIGYVDFVLVDVREWMEWVSKRIKGTDYLIPTTSFYQSLEEANIPKDKPIILYCLTGSRSAYCQYIMQNMGYKRVSNFVHGIIAFGGECESGR
jgi:ferredoxin-thioredoxin reductase catalytic subunit/rhodanese-related sulfurtransferase